MEETVILVDKDDSEIGTEQKLKAHLDKKLHRAISVLIFNLNGEMLLQQRSASKYHCPLMWSNACCTHPRPGESVLDAAHRRLNEELGFDCDLEEITSFIYEAKVGNGLYEHEYDHVFAGSYDGGLNINSAEVESYRWLLPDDLISDVKVNPGQYTEWFKIILNNFVNGKFDI